MRLMKFIYLPIKLHKHEKCYFTISLHSLYLSFCRGISLCRCTCPENTLLAEAAVLIFGIQLLVFLPSYWAQTEHFYDLTGGITYLSTMGYMAFRHQAIFGAWDLRSLVTALLVSGRFV